MNYDPQKSNDQLVEHYARGGRDLGSAIAGMTIEQLLAVPIPGKWSTHTVVIHVVDAENALIDRMKRIITMDSPTLLEWPENGFASRLFYDKQSAADAVIAFEAQRRNMTVVLKSLSPGDFERTGEHNTRGRWTLRFALERAVLHLEHHLGFIAEKRAALGLVRN